MSLFAFLCKVLKAYFQVLKKTKQKTKTKTIYSPSPYRNLVNAESGQKRWFKTPDVNENVSIPSTYDLTVKPSVNSAFDANKKPFILSSFNGSGSV